MHWKPNICKKRDKCGRYSDATPAYCVVTRDCIQFSLEHQWEQYCFSLVKMDITKFYGRKKISTSFSIKEIAYNDSDDSELESYSDTEKKFFSISYAKN